MSVDIYNFSELVSFLIIFIINIIVILKLSTYFKISKIEIMLLYIWHSIFACVFLLVDLNHGHDASGWYVRGHIENFGINNDFMYFLSGLLQSFKINYLAQNLLFNLLGSITLIIFYSKTKEYSKDKDSKKFYPLVLIMLLLPGFSFWTSGITKDTLSIFGLFLLYLSINKKFNLNIFVLSLIVLFLTRSFLIIFFVFGSYIFLVLKIYFSKKIKSKNKIFAMVCLLLLIIPTAFSLNLISLFTSQVDPSMDLFKLISQAFRFIGVSQSYYSNDTYGIPQDINIISRIFYFLYKPFIGDPISLFSGYFILENIFLLILTVILILNLKFNFDRVNNKKKIFYISIILMLVINSLFFSNYGIALRYKWLTVPFLVLAFLDFRKKKLA